MINKPLFFAVAFLLSLAVLFMLPSGLTGFAVMETPLAYGSEELASPADRIQEQQIEILDDRIIIHITDPRISRYANTNSMDPLLDEHSNGIEIIPEDESDIYVGDIVTYEQDNLLVVHRVTGIGEDEQGIYYVVKGDNNQEKGTKIRFRQIRYITIGILY